MRRKFKFIISCNEANLVCDKTQYKESSFWEKAKLNLHLLYCSVCRKYTKNNTQLTKKIKESNVVCLDKERKEYIKKDFENVLNANSF